jgi:hypothetical protein
MAMEKKQVNHGKSVNHRMGHVPGPGYVKLPLWSLNKIQSNPIQDAHFTGPTCLVSKGLEVIASLSSIILLVEMGISWTHRVEKICNKPKLPELFQFLSKNVSLFF